MQTTSAVISNTAMAVAARELTGSIDPVVVANCCSKLVGEFPLRGFNSVATFAITSECFCFFKKCFIWSVFLRIVSSISSAS